MLLLVDAGNTRTKWAMLAVATLEKATLGDFPVSGSIQNGDIAQLCQEWRGRSVARAVVSNVAGPAIREKLEQAMRQAFGSVVVEWFASVRVLGGVCNGYRNPAQLGCDRFASLIGARALFPGQALVVATCGTATTIDAVTEDGAFIGGMILPGLGTMAASLAKNTAHLPEAVHSHGQVHRLFADNTEDAIGSGCTAAQAGAIERAFAEHVRQHAGALCVLAGGSAHAVSPSLSIAHRTVNNLVLVGLQALAMSQMHSGTSC